MKLWKLLALINLKAGMVLHVNVPMRVGGDPGKWTDCSWAYPIIGPGHVVNLNGRLMPWYSDGGYGYKGVEIVGLVDLYPGLDKGRILVSSGADSGYDVGVNVEDLIAGRFKTSNIILATLSVMDLAPLLNHSLHLTICSGIGVGGSVGSSAAVQEALVQLLCGPLDPYELAMAIVHAEIDIAGRAAGNQDPLAAAYGSINGDACLSIVIDSNFPEATVEVLPVGRRIRAAYNDRAVLTFIGSHDSSREHGLARARMESDLPRARRVLGKMRTAAEIAREAVLQDSVSGLADALNLTCTAHREIHPALIGKPARGIMQLAEKYDALCGMMPGAGGGGGSVLSLFPTKKQANRFARCIKNKGYQPYRIELTGSSSS